MSIFPAVAQAMRASSLLASGCRFCERERTLKEAIARRVVT